MTDLATAPAAAPIAASAPRIRDCAFCGSKFEAPSRGPGQHKKFCGPKCRTDFGNREKAQGAALVTIAKVWRQCRGSGDLGKAAFAEMTSILDILNGRDREDGIPSLKPYVADMLSGINGDSRDRYLDRQHDAHTRRVWAERRAEVTPTGE